MSSDYLGTIFGGLLGVLGSVIVGNATLAEVAEMLFCWAKQTFCWLISVMIDDLPVWALFDAAVQALPEQLPFDFSLLSVFYVGLDTWVPLTEALGLWVAYGALLGVILALRTVFRFIPTMS